MMTSSRRVALAVALAVYATNRVDAGPMPTVIHIVADGMLSAPSDVRPRALMGCV